MARPKSANLGYASQVVKQLTSLLHSDLYAMLRSVDVVCCRCLTTGVGRTFLELYALHFFFWLPRGALWCPRTASPQDVEKHATESHKKGESAIKFDPTSFVVETPFHQATAERPAGLIFVEKIGLARRRLPPNCPSVPQWFRIER